MSQEPVQALVEVLFHFLIPLIPRKPKDAAIEAYMAHWNQSGVVDKTSKPRST